MERHEVVNRNNPDWPTVKGRAKTYLWVSKSRKNVRPSVQQKCHSIMPRWYQMMS